MKALLFTALLFPVILPATTAHGETIKAPVYKV